MVRLRLTTRRRPRAIAAALASGLVATMMAGCALKKPPDAAAVKQQALPAVQTPEKWTARARAPVACPTTGSRSFATISWRPSRRTSRTTSIYA